jgi:hypothetical protein
MSSNHLRFVVNIVAKKKNWQPSMDATYKDDICSFHIKKLIIVTHCNRMYD